MTILVTGAAGFIGFHVCQSLLLQNFDVIGIDNLNAYYPVSLKEDRLNLLKINSKFSFYPMNIAERTEVTQLITNNPDITHIIHLAAQAGVRYSLINPYAYSESNLVGQLNILEASRFLPKLKHLVYASSSSVYGANQKLPFSVQDRTDHPISLYAATKRSSELMAYTYSHLYSIPMTGLRFFTVYGPWGRPDMSSFIFTRAILAGEEIPIFNHGDMRRNFTYITDIVDGILGALNHLPTGEVPHKIYNLGNNESESLMEFVAVLEKITGKKAKLRFEDIQPGDVKETVADITDATRDFGFTPKIPLSLGMKQFVEWYRSYYGL